MSEFFEEFPTPPEPSEMERSKYDSAHRSKSGGSLREAKKKIGEIIRFLSPFERRSIVLDDGRRYYILAIEEGVAEADLGQEWQIALSGQGKGRVYIGTTSGMGIGNEPPDGKTLYDWYEFNLEANGATTVALQITFDPDSVETDVGWRLDDGGTITEVALGILSPAQLAAYTSVAPVINVSTGAVVTQGEYMIILGQIEDGVPQNYRIGPLAVWFCAPATFGGITDGSQYRII